jgi:hypothetical protein
MPRNIDDTDLLKLLNGQYGTKPLVQYYLRRAKDAAGRARVALSSQNPYALGAEAQTMITNIEMIARVLGDDDRTLGGENPDIEK